MSYSASDLLHLTGDEYAKAFKSLYGNNPKWVPTDWNEEGKRMWRLNKFK